MILALLLAVTPDLSGMLKLTSGDSIAHACPIAMDKALTNQHVMSGASRFIWGVSDGEEFHGLVEVDRSEDFRDLTYIRPVTVTRFPKWYSIAKAAPKIGDKVFFMGYDWSKQKNAFGPYEFDAKVTRILNGQLVFEPAGKPGSSGSCILNEAGEVVAINQGGKATEDEKLSGIGVGVWGDWLQLKPEEPPQEVETYFSLRRFLR